MKKRNHSKYRRYIRPRSRFASVIKPASNRQKQSTKLFFDFTFILAGLMTAVLLIYYVLLHFKPLEKTEIRNNLILSEGFILKTLDLDKQASFAGFDPFYFSKKITQNQWIEYARVRRLPPNKVEVFVKEREPIAFFKTSNRFFLIDENRVVLELLNNLKAWDLPVIVDDNLADEINPGDIFLSGSLIKSIELIKVLEKDKTLPLESVSEIVITDHVNIELVTMPDNIRIKMGLGDFEAKLLNLRSAMAEIVRSKKSIKKLDLRYRNKIVIGK